MLLRTLESAGNTLGRARGGVTWANVAAYPYCRTARSTESTRAPRRRRCLLDSFLVAPLIPQRRRWSCCLRPAPLVFLSDVADPPGRHSRYRPYARRGLPKNHQCPFARHLPQGKRENHGITGATYPNPLRTPYIPFSRGTGAVYSLSARTITPPRSYMPAKPGPATGQITHTDLIWGKTRSPLKQPGSAYQSLRARMHTHLALFSRNSRLLQRGTAALHQQW